MEKKPAARGVDEESKAPLLEPACAWPPADSTDRTRGSSDDSDRDEKEEGLGRRLVEENRKLWAVAGPSICTRFSTFGLTVISQAFIGHIGPTELAAYALVSTVLMRFSIGVLDYRNWHPLEMALFPGGSDLPSHVRGGAREWHMDRGPGCMGERSRFEIW